MIAQIPARPPRVINVMGIDGSGKSTVANHLATRLRAQGYEVDVVWLRFNHFISKPLLGICRVFGFTRYETRHGIRVGYHDFHRSKVIAWLFIFFQYLDALRVRLTKINPATRGINRVLIIDRYVFDIIVDLMVDTGMADLHESSIGRAFKKLMPKSACVLLIDRDPDAVCEARPENRMDENFPKRFEYYRSLANERMITRVPNDGNLDGLLRKAEALVGGIG